MHPGRDDRRQAETEMSVQYSKFVQMPEAYIHIYHLLYISIYIDGMLCVVGRMYGTTNNLLLPIELLWTVCAALRWDPWLPS
jgi:hypothetical protein